MANGRKGTQDQEARGVPVWAEPEPPREYRYERWFVVARSGERETESSSSERRGSAQPLKSKGVGAKAAC